MTDYDTFAVFAAVYDNQATAEQDYEAVKSLYYDWQLIDNFDAAIVAKHDDGKVKIVKKHEQPTRTGGWKGAGWGLATGAVVALFPAAAIGGGLLAMTTGGGAAIGAIAGHVSKGMNRGDLKELGEHLDAGECGLVVVAAADVSAKVEQVIANAQAITSKDLQALEDELDADVKAAQEEESS
jgi:uncharacterized membrane protein